MNDLRRRLETLEQRAGNANRVTVIVRTFVKPGKHGPEGTGLKALACPGGGWRVDREPDEEREAFIARAQSSAPIPAHGVVCLREVL